MENIKDVVQATLNRYKHHAAGIIIVRDDITLGEFAAHVLHMAHVALHTCNVNIPELRTLNFHPVTEATADDLDFIKKDIIQAKFDAVLKIYQRPLKDIEKLDKQYVSIRDSKNPSKARLEVLADETAALHAESRAAFPAVLNARRAEETFRAIPAAYRNQTVDSWNTALSLMLLADGYNPDKFILADSVRKFAQ